MIHSDKWAIEKYMHRKVRDNGITRSVCDNPSPNDGLYPDVKKKKKTNLPTGAEKGQKWQTVPWGR